MCYNYPVGNVFKALDLTFENNEIFMDYEYFLIENLYSCLNINFTLFNQY